MPSHFLLRYGEIALKGQNQRFFLDTLAHRVEEAVVDLGRYDVRIVFGRVLVEIDADRDAAIDRLRKIFGVVSLSPVRLAALSLEAVTEAAVDLVAASLEDHPAFSTFKVDTRRADKQFTPSSMETSSLVGAAIGQRFPHLRAQMRAPDLVVRIELRDQAYLTTEVIPGPGGLPVGTSGRALALISGGIDSPVATWLGARRGLIVIGVHFHSFPFTSERAKDKVVDLCRVLARYTGPLPLWVVFFTEIQRAIQVRVPDAYRVVVMRRMMMRISDALAAREHAQALLTGESLGQVASQTIEAIAAINAVTTLPVLRPLIGADKTEIVARAEEIGTYEISIRPYEDCCSLFVPAHPRTQPDLEDVVAAEAALNIPALVAEALTRSTRMDIAPNLPVAVPDRAGTTQHLLRLSD